MIASAELGLSAAELCRRVGDAAGELGVPRPSYQQVRVLLLDRRLARRHVSATELLTDVVLRARPATDIDAWLADVPLPYRPGAHNEPQD